MVRRAWSKEVAAGAHNCGFTENNLTRRAKHWHTGMIAKSSDPRGTIRRGFFHVGARVAMIKESARVDAIRVRKLSRIPSCSRQRTVRASSPHCRKVIHPALHDAVGRIASCKVPHNGRNKALANPSVRAQTPEITARIVAATGDENANLRSRLPLTERSAP